MNLQELDPAVLTDLAISYAVSVIGALIFLVVAWIFAAWARRSLRRTLERTDLDLALALSLSGMARWGILLLALLTALTMFGVQVTTFAAVIGAAGLAIGLAFQGTLSHFANGILLLTTRPFTVGDTVEVRGVRGTVAEIQLFTTIFDTFDNRRVFVPNSQVFDDVIENATYHPTRRIEVPVGASYDASVDETRAALESALEAVDGILEEPAPQVLLKDLGGSSVDWAVRAWTPTADMWTIREALVRAVKMELDAAGIGIPYPNMDVHMDGTLELAGERRSEAGGAVS